MHATAQAQQMIYNMVQRQATLLAFLENFRLLAYHLSGRDSADVADEEDKAEEGGNSGGVVGGTSLRLVLRGKPEACPTGII